MRMAVPLEQQGVLGRTIEENALVGNVPIFVDRVNGEQRPQGGASLTYLAGRRTCSRSACVDGSTDLEGPPGLVSHHIDEGARGDRVPRGDPGRV